MLYVIVVDSLRYLYKLRSFAFGARRERISTVVERYGLSALQALVCSFAGLLASCWHLYSPFFVFYSLNVQVIKASEP